MDNDSNRFIVRSPDGTLELCVQVLVSNRKEPKVYYTLNANNQSLLLNSEVGLLLWKNKPILRNDVMWTTETRTVQNTWYPLYGERKSYPDNYHEFVLTFIQSKTPSNLQYSIIFRVYNEGFAIKYDIITHPDAKNDELLLRQDWTEFHFPPLCYCYEEHGTEGEYHYVRVNSIKPGCERPLTVVYPHGEFLLLTEANNYDFPRMLLRRSSKNKNIIIPDINNQKMSEYIPSIWSKKNRSQKEIKINLPYSTPWRVCIIGTKPGDLLERNYLIENLSAPNQIQNPEWIKPGKVFRDITLSTPNALNSIDFAVTHHIEYIMFDAGWYGPEHDDLSDATTVALDPARTRVFPNHPGLDLPRVCQYAKEKGIGIILYVNHRALRQQLDRILPLYQRWGIKGLKFGFVGVGPQEINRWIHDSVKKCAAYHLVVNIHDSYRPSGFSRTYPNLLTQEGIRGNEHMPTARHNCTLPFTRFPMGAGDATVCYYDKRIKTTHAHQLAMAIIIYSPLQTILWYDKPDDFQGEAEIALFEQLPTYWDESKVLSGEIGEYVLIARCKDEKWFVGGITNENEREIFIDFGFLKGNKYSALVFEDSIDNKDSPTNVLKILNFSLRTQIRMGELKVDSNSKLCFKLKSSGGMAMILTPL
jgi:alpha-glucosidase